MKKKLVVAIAMMIMMVMAFAGTAFGAYNSIELGTTTAAVPVRHSVMGTNANKFTFKAPEDGIYTFNYVLKGVGNLDIIRNDNAYYGDISETPGAEVSYAIYLEKGDVDKIKIYSQNIIGTQEEIDNAKCEITVKQAVTVDTELVIDDVYRETSDGNVRISLETYGNQVAYIDESFYPYNVISAINVKEIVDDVDYIKTYDLILEKDKDYVVLDKNGEYFDFDNIKVGADTMTVKFCDDGLAKIFGAEKGRTISYTVVPANVKVTSVTADTGKITVKADKKLAATGAAKFKIAYRVKGTTTWKYVTTTSQTKTIKNLKKGKAYQVKIKAIKTVKDIPYEGEWSKIKTSAQVK